MEEEGQPVMEPSVTEVHSFVYVRTLSIVFFFLFIYFITKEDPDTIFGLIDGYQGCQYKIDGRIIL